MSGQTLIQSRTTDKLETFRDSSLENAHRGEILTSLADVRKKLIVALDFSTVSEAKDLVTELKGTVSFFKIDIALQMAEGVTGFVRNLTSNGNLVFWDGKWHDVPETVMRAVNNAISLDVSFLTVHDSGKTIRTAVRAARGSPLSILAVTVLTSYEESDIFDFLYPEEMQVLGTSPSIEEVVLQRAKRAIDEGCAGVIASGHEVQRIRAIQGGKGLLIVTPGIRQVGALPDDQKRTITPRDAMRVGADYIVVGRPIRTLSNPKAAAEQIIHEMEEGWKEREQTESLKLTR